jgi:hypothetical protein
MFVYDERTWPDGKQIQIDLDAAAGPAELRVTVWWLYRAAVNGKPQRGILVDNKKLAGLGPVKYTPNGKGLHTIVVLAWDNADQPTKKKRRHFACYTIPIHVT